ncbi:uncharacterized protein TNCV_1041491 [Trichonephila clavipes]|nr:uncharacterized protein TNCV_1041491 [Trichonephila clavipes]
MSSSKVGLSFPRIIEAVKEFFLLYSSCAIIRENSRVSCSEKVHLESFPNLESFSLNEKNPTHVTNIILHQVFHFHTLPAEQERYGIVRFPNRASLSETLARSRPHERSLKDLPSANETDTSGWKVRLTAEAECFSLAEPSGSSIKHLSQISVGSRGRAFENHGKTPDTYSSLLYPIILKSIPRDLSLEFTRKSYGQTENMVSDLLDFLKIEIQRREKNEHLAKEFNSYESNTRKDTRDYYNERENHKHSKFNKYNVDSTYGKNKNSYNVPTTSTFVVNVNKHVFCLGTDNKNDHSFDSCPKSIEERKLSLRKNGICYLCLPRGHISRACMKARVCVNCKSCHSKLICDTSFIPANIPANPGSSSQKAGVCGLSPQCDTPTKTISCCNVNTIMPTYFSRRVGLCCIVVDCIQQEKKMMMSETHSEKRKFGTAVGSSANKKARREVSKKYEKFTEDCIPDGVFPIGDDVFVFASTYYDSVSVHIRRFKKYGKTYYPTPEGITLDPRWIEYIMRKKKVPETQEELPSGLFPPE